MRKVLIYSALLIIGLIGSQLLPHTAGVSKPIEWLTMWALSFIMIHVGYEFEIDRARPLRYAWDFVVATTAASLPWLLCALYLVVVMSPPSLWSHPDLWRRSLLEGLFAAPTSAGVLFAMLAAAGLGATWVFAKARVLAIFDDLSTILLLIPLKAMMIGFRWQLAVVLGVVLVLLYLAWRHLHAWRIPAGWPWVLAYAAAITAGCEGIYVASKALDPGAPIHLEALLPAFALGCMLARPAGSNPHVDDAKEGVEEGPESPVEQRVSTVVSACFMVLVGLSMPPIGGGGDGGGRAGVTSVLAYAGADRLTVEAMDQFPGWGVIALHVLALTVLSNLGKMVPALCYRREASWRERLALAVGMFPRGEVGAGVLVVALSYGLAGPTLTAAVLSLTLNLLLTGPFIVVVKRLLAGTPATQPGRDAVPYSG